LATITIATPTYEAAVAPTTVAGVKAPEVVLPEGQRANPIGIVAMGLGTLAILLACAPTLRITALGLGAIGVLLAIVSLVYRLVSKRFNARGSAIGLALSCLGIVVSLVASYAKAQAEAAAYTKESVEKFAKFRESVRGIAAREGKTPTNEFALEILHECEASKILMLEEYVAAKEAFLDYGGQYVSRTNEPGSRQIERTTLQAILPDMMAYAKMTKLSSRVVARFVAEIIKQMPKGSSAEDYKSVFAKIVMVAVERTGSAEKFLGQLIPFLDEQVGQGRPFGPGEKGILSASVFLMVQDYDHPGESYTYGNAALQTLAHIHRSGRDGELGISDDMTPSGKIEAIYKAFKKSGEKDFAAFLAPYTEE
jgi:hypothetical protein